MNRLILLPVFIFTASVTHAQIAIPDRTNTVEISNLDLLRTYVVTHSVQSLQADKFVRQPDGSVTIVSPRFYNSGESFPFAHASDNLGCSDESIATSINAICKLAGFKRRLSETHRLPLHTDPKHHRLDYYLGMQLDESGGPLKICPAKTLVSSITCK